MAVFTTAKNGQLLYPAEWALSPEEEEECHRLFSKRRETVVCFRKWQSMRHIRFSHKEADAATRHVDDFAAVASMLPGLKNSGHLWWAVSDVRRGAFFELLANPEPGLSDTEIGFKLSSDQWQHWTQRHNKAVSNEDCPNWKLSSILTFEKSDSKCFCEVI